MTDEIGLKTLYMMSLTRRYFWTESRCRLTLRLPVCLSREVAMSKQKEWETNARDHTTYLTFTILHSKNIRRTSVGQVATFLQSLQLWSFGSGFGIISEIKPGVPITLCLLCPGRSERLITATSDRGKVYRLAIYLKVHEDNKNCRANLL